MTGVYVPEFYRPEYGTDGTIKGVYKLNESAPDIVQRYILPETENVQFPVKPVIPMVEAVHDRAVVETFRGCTRGRDDIQACQREKQRKNNGTG